MKRCKQCKDVYVSWPNGGCHCGEQQSVEINGPDASKWEMIKPVDNPCTAMRDPNCRRVMYILRGPSGSGKSTWGSKFQARLSKAETLIVSADHFFEQDGEYNFNPALLGKAHADCQRKAWQFVDLMSDRDDIPVAVLIVDNTNTTDWECDPYRLLAELYGWEVREKVFMADMRTCAARNKHGVPADSICRQIQRLKDSLGGE